MKKNIDLALINREKKYWKTVEESCLDEYSRILFNKRKMAVDMYLEGYSLKQIIKTCDFKSLSEVKRLLNRCLVMDEYGRYQGYVALLPYKRISNSYNRTKKVEDYYSIHGNSGVFSKLLLDHPELKLYLNNLYFGKQKDTLEKNMKIKYIHKKFLYKCRTIGIKEYEYPFNVRYKGIRSLYTYFCNLSNENPLEIKNRLDDNANEKMRSTGLGTPLGSPAIRPFSIVQLDGHKIDCITTIEIITPTGEKVSKTIQRFWLLVLIDVATRTILGYHLTVEAAYNRFDVLKCIKNAILPKVPIEFSIKGMKYPENYGFHSLAIPETEWAIFNELQLDNAKAHLSGDVLDKIINYLSASVNFGPVAIPERRGIIERFFKTLESNGFHRVVSTTGTGINDPTRRNAEEDAIKYKVTFDQLKELTEVLIAQYNNSPHNANNGFSPLETMKQRIENGIGINYLESSKRSNFMLDCFSVTRKIRGKIGTGKRPYVNFEGAEYRSDVLSSAFDLVGKNLILKFNPDDIRICKSYFEDGSEFCDLSVTGKWRTKAHTLDQRKAANRLLNDLKLKDNSFIDPVQKLEEELMSQSLNSKRARNKLASLKLTQRQGEVENINTTIESRDEIIRNIEENSSKVVANTYSKKTDSRKSSRENEKLLTQEELDMMFENPKNRIRLS